MRKERQKGQDRWVSFSHVTKVEAKVISSRAPWFTVYVLPTGLSIAYPLISGNKEGRFYKA